MEILLLIRDMLVLFFVYSIGVYVGYLNGKREKPAPVMASEGDILNAILRFCYEEVPAGNSIHLELKSVAERLAEFLVGKVAASATDEGYLAEYQDALSMLNDADKKIAELEEWKWKVMEEAQELKQHPDLERWNGILNFVNKLAQGAAL